MTNSNFHYEFGCIKLLNILAKLRLRTLIDKLVYLTAVSGKFVFEKIAIM
ncbi:MAG: hypothetical protein GY777_01725 [Candidatus Brocadiaceae bacterium]|nr:hypothetical protein [Candidatus Brocadiaceae bacterium]